MNFLGDYHTHTIYSRNAFIPYRHAKGTLEDNIAQAKKLGLKEIAITDHGFSHKFYGCNRKYLPHIKSEIIRLGKKYDIKVYLGIEANFISLDGTIDVTDEDRKYLDIVLCGFHSTARPKTWGDKFKIFIANFFARIFGTSPKQKEKNTQMILNALDKNKIDVITHLNTKLKCDTLRVAKKAKEVGTLIELNEKHCGLFTPEEIKSMVEMGVKFIVDSDAHKPEKIAKFSRVEKLIKDNNIPPESIVNLESVPEFLNQKGKGES